jgi:anaerobic selenocysteine-containing dehydrogenase
MIEIKKTICPLDCPDCCALIATIENGKLIRLEGDADHEITRGFICRKMKHYPERVESPDRILHPLVRTGEKGFGIFKRISWEEAWKFLVDKLQELKTDYGGESLLPYSYAGNMGHISQHAGRAFFNKFGASRLGNTICSAAAKAGWRAHLGNRPGTDPERAADSDLIVAWGINVKISNVHFWPLIQKSRRNGGKLVVIDPYRNITAKAADYYFPVKPGGDPALALGILKTLIGDRKVDIAFIRDFTTGFTDLQNYVTGLSWQAIEHDSGLGQEEIGQLAHLLEAHPKTFIRIGIGLSRNSRGAMSVRAIVCLALALGLLDNGEGKGVLLSSGGFSGNIDKLTYPSLLGRPTRQINMVQLGNALTTLTPKIHGLFVYNSNPLSVAPEASLVKKGLEREDLFTVVHEQVMTPTARYADLILPATTSLENRDIYLAYGHFYLGTTEPVIPPRGEAIDNFTLFQTLALKLGYADAPFKQTLEERLQDYLSDMKGFPPEKPASQLKPGEFIRSVYADGQRLEKNHLPYQFVARDLETGQSAIPCVGPLAEFDDPELATHFPLKLITPPNGNLLNSTFGDRFPNESGQILIHPGAAASRKINSGDRVLIYNQRGSIVRTARVTDDTQPDLVVAEGIYWENPACAIQGVNQLTSQQTTDLAGGGTFHESRVEIILAQ